MELTIDTVLQVAEKRLELYLKFRDELTAHPATARLLDGADPASQQAFISDMALIRAEWTCMTHFRTGHICWHTSDERYAGFTFLSAIQQAKLFALQCRWRAEEITLPGITLHIDFIPHQVDIFNCPLISPISDDEYDLMLRFLTGSEITDFDCEVESGQNHPYIISEFASDSELVMWYRFYFEATGQSHLFDLPDIRGMKEQRYIDLWKVNVAVPILHDPWLLSSPIGLWTEEELKLSGLFSEDGRLRSSEEPDELSALGIDRPGIDESMAKELTIQSMCNWEEAQRFSETYGDTSLAHWHRTAWQLSERIATNEEYSYDFASLLRNDRPMPVQATEDWIEEVIQAAEIGYRQRSLEQLPRSLQELREGKDIKRPVWPERSITNNPQSPLPTVEALMPVYIDCILQGRELAGEPRDFNF